MLFSARSEMKKGFTMPTVKKIKAVLRTRSKTFLINLIMVMFSKMTKTAKISFLMKIDRRSVKRKARKVKRKSTRKGMRRKTARPAYKKPKNGRKKARSPAQKANDKRLGQRAKARAKKRR
tara:strand:- start:218 stop:580 length:363 start_codon:yes stop_codon:yes gene_type:complete